jgi:hypothetical protein
VKTIGQEAWTIPFETRVGFFQPFIAVSTQLGTIVKNSRTQPQIFPTHMPETPQPPITAVAKNASQPFPASGYRVGKVRGGKRLYGFPTAPIPIATP